MHIGSLSQTEAQEDPLGRKFFESSVYRNVFDMVKSVESRFSRFENILKKIIARASINDAPNLTKLVLGNTSIRATGNRPAWIWASRINNMKWQKFKQKRSNLAQSVNPQTMNFLANDIVREVISLERELNRIHIPMPGDFRSWADKVRNLSNDISKYPIMRVRKVRKRVKEPDRWVLRNVEEFGPDWEGIARPTFRLWNSVQKMHDWLDKIKKSIKQTELRAEEVKKKQQEQAEKAYQKRLEEERKKKAAEEAVKQQKQKEKQAAEKAKQEAEKVATETGMSDTERQQAIQQAVTQAVGAQRAEFQALLEQLRAQAEQASGTANGAEKDAAKKMATSGGQGQVNPAILALAAAAALVLMEGA